jgi:hypothetical protein
VIDNVVWTNSWLSIAGAGCCLTSVDASEEQVRKVIVGEASRSLSVRPPNVEKTSRLRSRDPVASGVKCGPHCGKNDNMKSWTVSWLSLKTKVEPGLRGSRVMSGNWRRLHRVHGVSGGSPENHWVPWFINKAKTEEPKTKVQQHWTGLTGGSDWSDQCATTQFGDFEAEDTRRDRKACVESKQVCGRWASVRWCYEDNFPKCPWWACILV